MERNAAYQPPGEVPAPTGAETEHRPPSGYVGYWNWSRIRDDAGGVATGRLAPWLREAARMDVRTKLLLSCRRRLEGDATAADAIADLAVTGRASYAEFRRLQPRDDTLLDAVSSAMPGGDASQVRAAVRATLDRAYTVVWALRGAPRHRAALRPGLGWIAVSSEDDPAHAPTNRGCTQDHMGELHLAVPGAADPVAVCRVAIKVPRTPASPPLPDLASRPLPDDRIFMSLITTERDAHYDDLALFIHGLGSRLEESDRYKQALIDRAAECGRRLAVLSLDMPGMGYSSRIRLDDLLRSRVRGTHGFVLPDGRGSNFPLLGYYRDILVKLSNHVARGIQYVMGGSLGGNMTLWLAEEPMFSASDSVRRMGSALRFASWSPGSIWESYERSRDTFVEGNGTHMDVGKNGAKKQTRERMNRAEDGEARRSFFEPMQRGEAILGIRVLGAWGYPPTMSGLLDQAEFYGPDYRRVFWAAAYDQVTFSHQEPLAPGRKWPFATIDRPVLLASGARDTGEAGVMDIYNEVVKVSDHLPGVPGERLLLLDTGHSISDERPAHLAYRVSRFFWDTRAAGPRGMRALDTYWSDARGDNFATCTRDGRDAAVQAGYRLVRTEGFVSGESRPGMLALKLFWHGGRGDNFVTTTSKGEQDALAAGYAFVRVEGHVWAAWRPDTVALDLYWSPDRADNFSTATQKGRQDALDAGYVFVRTEGYIHPATVVLRTRGAFVGAAEGGGPAGANQASIGRLSKFEVAYGAGDRIALRTIGGRFLRIDDSPAGQVIADRTEIGDQELFQPVAAPGNRVCLRAANGRFVGMRSAGGPLAADHAEMRTAEHFEMLAP